LNKKFQLLKHHARRRRQFILYGIIGASGALLDLILFAVLYNIFGVNPLLATALSTTAGIVNNFFLNIRFNFKVKNKMRQRLASFYFVGLTGLALSVAIISVAHDTFGLNANIAKLISIPIIVIFQYVLNKKISFSNNFDAIKAVKKNKNTLLKGGLLLGFYGLFMWHSTYLAFQDEIDNILGGWLMAHQGQVVYRDFFSHHMPLGYFVSAVISFFVGNDINLFRFIYVSGLFAWLLLIMKQMSRAWGIKAAYLFGLIIALMQYTYISHMLLAESLVAYATIHGLSLIGLDLFRTRRPTTHKDIIAISILGATPVLASVSYVWISVALYVAFGYYYFIVEKRFANGLTKKFVRDAVVLSLPHIALLTYLISNHALSEFRHDAFQFNTKYYSQFTSDVGDGFWPSLVNQASAVAKSISEVLYVTPHGLRPILTIGFLAVLSALAVMYAKKQYALLILFGSLIYASAVRGAISTDPVTEGTSRMMVYGFIVCFSIPYLYYECFVVAQKKSDKHSNHIVNTGKVMAIVAGGMLILQGLTTNLSISSASQQIETGISSPARGGETARIINLVNKNTDTYWIGPWDFYTQMYIDSPRATRYTFFLPWHNRCPECQEEFIRQIKTEKPNVIYWQHGVQMIGYDVDSYNGEFLEILETQYYQFPDKSLRGLYFKKDNLQNSKDILLENRILTKN
jgi:putative flippase GtrA